MAYVTVLIVRAIIGDPIVYGYGWNRSIDLAAGTCRAYAPDYFGTTVVLPLVTNEEVTS